jgi:hypothetical protein
MYFHYQIYYEISLKKVTITDGKLKMSYFDVTVFWNMTSISLEKFIDSFEKHAASFFRIERFVRRHV